MADSWEMVSISSSEVVVRFFAPRGYNVINLKDFVEMRHKTVNNNKNNDAYFLSISILLSEGWEPYAATEYDMLFRKSGKIFS